MMRHARLCLIVCGAALALTTAACTQPSAAKHNQDGNRAYNRGDYATALEDYRKAQVERPDISGFNYNAGNVLFQQGEYERGVTESLRSTQAGPPDIQEKSYYTIGADYYRDGKLQDALDAFKNALRIDPTDLDAKYNVEVIQRRLDKEAADRQQLQQQQQDQQNQQQNQQDQQGQQGENQGQQGQQSGQQGQQQAGNQGQQPGQPQAGQQNQSGQPNGASQSPAQGQGATPQGGAANAGPGSTNNGPSPQDTRAQQAALAQQLQDAQRAYDQSPSIEQALRILDILAQQEQLAQSDRANRTDPRTPDK